METHAHHLHKAPGNGFKHYFFEFLMLFLAVFCGFLTENLREHRIEKDRALELAKSFYQELKSDSATAVIKVQNRLGVLKLIPYSKFIANGLETSVRLLSLKYFRRYFNAFSCLSLFRTFITAVAESLFNS